MASNGRPINWPVFYKRLSTFTVSMPSHDPGQPVSLSELSSLLIRVQTTRAGLDKIAMKLEQCLGEVKRKIDMSAEELRLMRSETENEPEVTRLPNAKARAAMVDSLCGRASARLAVLKSRREQYEAAKRAVAIQTATLETAKQTLNALKQIVLEEYRGSER